MLCCLVDSLCLSTVGLPTPKYLRGEASASTTFFGVTGRQSQPTLETPMLLITSTHGGTQDAPNDDFAQGYDFHQRFQVKSSKPTAPAAMMRSGSGSFLTLAKIASVVMAMITVAGSTNARLPRT